MNKQDFSDAIYALNRAGALSYILITGSWCQYIYSETILDGFIPSIRTKDIDLLYNQKPTFNEINLPVAEELKKLGYIMMHDYVDDTVKFVKGDDIELEFITKSIPSAERSYNKIASMGNITTVGIRDMNILADYPCEVAFRGMRLLVPKPAAFIMQKILSEPRRVPVNKRDKDIETAYRLYDFIKDNPNNMNDFIEIYDKLTKKQLKTFNAVLEKYDDKYHFDLFAMNKIKDEKNKEDSNLDSR